MAINEMKEMYPNIDYKLSIPHNQPEDATQEMLDKIFGLIPEEEVKPTEELIGDVKQNATSENIEKQEIEKEEISQEKLDAIPIQAAVKDVIMDMEQSSSEITQKELENLAIHSNKCTVKKVIEGYEDIMAINEMKEMYPDVDYDLSVSENLPEDVTQEILDKAFGLIPEEEVKSIEKPIVEEKVVKEESKDNAPLDFTESINIAEIEAGMDKSLKDISSEATSTEIELMSKPLNFDNEVNVLESNNEIENLSTISEEENIEEDDSVVSMNDLDGLLNSDIGVQKAEDVLSFESAFANLIK